MKYTVRNFVFAGTLMAIGLVLAMSWTRQQRADIARGAERITVLVAKQDIPAGIPAKDLDEQGYVEEKRIVREDAPPRPISDLADIAKLVSNETVYEGEVLTLRVFDRESGLAPTSQIKGTERLASFAFDVPNTVAGLVRAGDSVDFIASMRVDTEDGEQMVTRIIARDIQIMKTPTNLVPDEQTEDVEEAAPEANGDQQLYVIRATDREIADLTLAQSASDNQLRMLLRPTSGDVDSEFGDLEAAMSGGSSGEDQEDI